jgi:hypothetical protein
MEWYRAALMISMVLLAGLIIGYFIGKNNTLSNRQGKITVDDGVDDKAGLYMEFYVDYDTLFRQKYLVFDFENKLSKK